MITEFINEWSGNWGIFWNLMAQFVLLIILLHKKTKKQHNLLSKEICRKHFWLKENFNNCPECGWSGTYKEIKD